MAFVTFLNFVLLKTKKGYLEPSRTPTMKLFSENSWWLLAFKYFSSTSIIDVRLGFKYASETFTLTCIALMVHFIIFTPLQEQADLMQMMVMMVVLIFNLWYGINNILNNWISDFFEYLNLSGCQAYHQIPGCNLCFKWGKIRSEYLSIWYKIKFG